MVVGEYTARGLRDKDRSDLGRSYPACRRLVAVLQVQTSAVVLMLGLPAARWCRCPVGMSVRHLSDHVVLL